SLLLFFPPAAHHPHLPSFPTRRSSDLHEVGDFAERCREKKCPRNPLPSRPSPHEPDVRLRRIVERGGASLPLTPSLSLGERGQRSEEHTSELQSLRHLVCRLLLEKKKV